MIEKENYLFLIERALEEDIGGADLTTETIISPAQEAEALLIVREEGIVCGLGLAREVFSFLDEKTEFQPLVEDGTLVGKEQKVAVIKGKARVILTGERTALNFLQHLSGIATTTAKYVNAIKPFSVRLFDTRKTTPGWRCLEKYAVRMGGGSNHRLGLYDGILIKDNHLALAMQQNPGKERELVLKELVLRTREAERKKDIPIEIEVSNLNEFKAVILAEPDVIMLDNMSIVEIKKAVDCRNSHCLRAGLSNDSILVEVSGNISLDNIVEVAEAGIDRISVGSITHSAPVLDISLEI